MAHYLHRSLFLEQPFAADIRMKSDGGADRIAVTEGLDKKAERPTIAHELGHAADNELERAMEFLSYALLSLHIPLNAALLTSDVSLALYSLAGIGVIGVIFSVYSQIGFEKTANQNEEQETGEMFEVEVDSYLEYVLFAGGERLISFVGYIGSIYWAFLSLYWLVPKAIWETVEDEIKLRGENQ